MNSTRRGITSEVGPCKNSPWIDYFCFAIAIAYLLLHYLARSGFPRSMGCYLGGACLCAVLHLGPRLISRMGRALASIPFSILSLVLLLLLCLSGWVAGDNPSLRIVMYGAGVACVLYATIWVFQRQRNSLVVLLTVAGVFALFAVVDAWGGSNGVSGHPLFDEELASGQGDNDLLFHASMASMLQVHGVLSTGLHGVPTFTYHGGGQWISGMLCNLIGVHPVDFYTTLLVPIFYSFYLSSILRIVCCLHAGSGLSHSDDEIRRWLPQLGVLLLAEHTFLTQEMIEKLGLMLLQFSSQSYIIGAACLLASLAALLSLHQWAPMKKWAWALTFTLAPLLLFAIGFVKVTTGHLAFGIYALIVLFTGKWRRIPAILSVAVAGALMFALTRYVAGASKAVEGVSWFAFYREGIAPGWLWLHPLLQYWPLWLALAGALLLRKHLTIAQNRTMWIVGVISATVVLAAQAPCVILQFYGGAFYYTTLAANLSIIPMLLMITMGGERFGSRNVAQVSERNLTRVWLAGTGLLLAVSALWGAENKVGAILKKQMEIRSFYDARGGSDATTSQSPEKILTLAMNYVQSLTEIRVNQRPNYRLLLRLKEYGLDRASQCKRECIFVPRDNKRYWMMNRGVPWANCYIVPAYTRRCMIFGLPETEDPQVRALFGFSAYRSGWDRIAESRTEIIRDAVKNVCPVSVDRIRMLDPAGKLKPIP